MTFHVGTSGWQYKDWRGHFYPTGLPQRRWLEYYAEKFSTVEVNNTFYRLPERSTFEGWDEVLPQGFLVSVKMSRYLTHVRRLKDPAEPVARFLGRADALGAHLGPVLLQLPPNLAVDPDALDATLAEFGDSVRVVVEPRHTSWWVDEVREVLEHRNAALCSGEPPTSVISECIPVWPHRGRRTVRARSTAGSIGCGLPSTLPTTSSSTSTTTPVAPLWTTRSSWLDGPPDRMREAGAHASRRRHPPVHAERRRGAASFAGGSPMLAS